MTIAVTIFFWYHGTDVIEKTIFVHGIAAETVGRITLFDPYNRPDLVWRQQSAQKISFASDPPPKRDPQPTTSIHIELQETSPPDLYIVSNWRVCESHLYRTFWSRILLQFFGRILAFAGKLGHQCSDGEINIGNLHRVDDHRIEVITGLRQWGGRRLAGDTTLVLVSSFSRSGRGLRGGSYSKCMPHITMWMVISLLATSFPYVGQSCAPGRGECPQFPFFYPGYIS